MKPRQWMQVAAVASAVGLAGTAIANDIDSSSNAASSASAASAIDQAVPSNDHRSGSAMSDQNGNALSSPSDLDKDVPATGTPSGNASSRTSSDVDGSAATSGDVGPSANDLAAPSTDDVNAPSGTLGGATQGSTMQSPKPTGVPGSAASPARTPHERLSTTNSDNFNAWASDYAAQHNGRIGRQEFLDEMAQRFDQRDTQHQGSLTPYEVEEILIVTPQAQGSTESNGAQGAQESDSSSMSNSSGNGTAATPNPSTLQ